MSGVDIQKLMESLYPDKWLTLKQASVLSGLSVRMVKRKCDQEFILHQNYGGRDGYKIRWADLKDYMREHSVGRAA